MSGATATLSVVLSVDPSTGGGQDVIRSTASVIDLNEVDTNATNDSSTEATSVSHGVDIQVSTTQSADTVVAGTGPGNLTLEVTAANVGSSNVSGLTLSDVLTLPAGVSVDSITPAKVRSRAKLGQWEIWLPEPPKH